MFENLGWWEIGLLIALALIIFGPDRLPELVRDAARLLRRLRAMAREASGGLRDSLGPDVELEDLHPKRFVKKHLLNDDDLDQLRRPFDDVIAELDDTVPKQRLEKPATPAADAKPAGEVTAGDRPRFDPDAT